MNLRDERLKIVAVPSDDIPAEKQFFPLGYACDLLQISALDLRAAMERVGVKFCHAYRDVPHLDGVGLAAVSRHLRGVPSAMPRIES